MYKHSSLLQPLSKICSTHLFESLWYVLLHLLPTDWSKPLESISDPDRLSQHSFHFLINFWRWVLGFWVERKKETYIVCTFTMIYRTQDITFIMPYVYLSLYLTWSVRIM